MLNLCGWNVLVDGIALPLGEIDGDTSVAGNDDSRARTGLQAL